MKSLLANILAVVLTCHVVRHAAAADAIPITGSPVPELAAFDTAMTNFMRANNINGGALAVMRNGRLVLKHGYGWSDKAQTAPFDFDSRARVASNSKTFTAAAIKHLIERGVIATNTPAIPFAGITPFGGQWGDDRWQEIQVLQFLAHTSGWDNDIPDFPTEELLPIPDGGWDYLHESSIGPGGLIANVEALVTLAQVSLISHGNAFQPAAGIPSYMNGDRRQRRRLPQIRAQLGSEEGASSFNFQNINGVDFAFFLNRTVSHETLAFTLKRLTETTTAWPGDNSARITLAAESFTVGEEEGELVIGVRRTGESAGSVSANFTVAPGTAKAGIDFTPVTGAVQFADDEITALIAIPILANLSVDGTRDFTVVLSDPIGGAQFGISRALVAIEDDEIPAVPPAIQIAEPTADAILTVGTNLLKTVVTSGNRPVAKVEFFAGPTLLGEENKPPYTLAWKPGFRSGRFLLSARVTDDRGRSTTSSPVPVILGANPPPSAARGVLREFWTRRPGNGLTNLTGYAHFPARPTGWEVIESFEAPSNWGEYHGARLRGYLTPPRTGDYVFAITANDAAELWLSADERPANKRLLATALSPTAPGDWDNAPKSLPVPLQGGRNYYVEVLHKQRITGEHLAVGWQLPDGNLERPIPGERLIPFSAEPQPVLANVIPLRTGIRFSLHTSAARTHVIESSEDLIDWAPVWAGAVPGYSHEFEDAAAPNHPPRFYRARRAP